MLRDRARRNAGLNGLRAAEAGVLAILKDRLARESRAAPASAGH